MDKNRIHKIKSGKTERLSFGSKRDEMEMPDLIEVQKASFEWFLQDGLQSAFEDIFPIQENYAQSQLSLNFCGFRICPESMKYKTIEECKERDATYQAPLRVTFRLDTGTDLLKEQEVYLGDLPLMTDNGAFVINGAERVVVSQIVRSPGIYYDITHDKYGNPSYSAQVIPNRGAWLEYSTDSNDNFYVTVDRMKKVPVTTFVRALGYGSNAEILELFGNEKIIEKTLEKDKTTNCEQGAQELYSKLRPGEQATEEAAKKHIDGLLFESKRYDLARVGRHKFNKKLNFRYRLDGLTLAETVLNPETGEILADAGTVLHREPGKETDLLQHIQDSGVPYVVVEKDNAKVRILSSQMVRANEYLPFDPKEAGIWEMVYYPVLMEILDQKEAENWSDEALKKALIDRKRDLIPMHIMKEEILASINYLLCLEHGIGVKDDIDHLGNRRIRAVGELLQNQFRIGLTRMERTIKEKMSTASKDTDAETHPQSLINAKPLTAVIKEFFGSSQLSQFMDQNNPLSELTNKRRLSALGPGGLSRERAGFEVRDIHYTHYGRMCPIETPEGPNIGLINSLASYARINEYGFIEAPYRIVDKSDPENPVVTNEVIYLTADDEDDYVVAQANTELDEKGRFVKNAISGRFRSETAEFPKSRIDLMDVSPKMVFSVATAMIPFLENDDANRALMGSNMQRQAVPLMITETPVVDTGLAEKVARDSGACVIAKKGGFVTRAAADEILIANDDGNEDRYSLMKFTRSNQSNSYNQKPIVDKGERVEAGQIIADGPSTANGELALGKNPLIGFMTWEGYNYEDAVLLSERLVQEDVYTSIHIEEYSIDARDTKLGPEEITRDIPGLGADALKDLDEDGIIRIGAKVRAGDILVGKVTPKGETEENMEERLLHEIFGEKAKDVRDTSLKLPHGAYGTVVHTHVFTADSNQELPPGVSKSVCVYVAQKRKISVGDKMAGRHGNKGVVSRVLPVEDMPFLPNGRPLDIVLNPLGVPSRMNIGQVLETHLSLAAEALGFNIATPIFDGANDKDIGDMLEMANDYVNTEWDAFRKKYKDKIPEEMMEYLGSHLEHREVWKGVPITRDGKVWLRDGRTGEYFDAPVTIGHMHYLKLHHLVDDKIHARATGPYSLVTQQPLGGKAQFGGQRFGEMEVWALEAYGAAYTLQEILTVKSDDVVGRVKLYEAIIRGMEIPKAGIPESFKVLIKELQSLALDVRVLKTKKNPETGMTEMEEVEIAGSNYNLASDIRRMTDSDRRAAGLTTYAVRGETLVEEPETKEAETAATEEE